MFCLAEIPQAGPKDADGDTNAQEKKDPPKRDREGFFKKLDTDGDGKISKDEADKSEHKMIKDHFSEIDTNSDGYISKEEFKAFKPKDGPRRKG